MCGLKRCELKMGIDLNIASYAKMAAFSLIAGAAQNFVILGNSNKSFKKKIPPRFLQYDFSSCANLFLFSLGFLLIDKNKSFARPSRAFFNFVHFFQISGKSAT